MTDGDRLINITAEGALLGAMLLKNDLVQELADRVSTEDFADPLHGRIMNVLLRFAGAGKPATALTIRSVFKQDSEAQYGEYLDTLVEAPAAALAAPSLADQIADLSARRKAREAMREGVVSLEEEQDRAVDDICGSVESVGHAAASRTRVDIAYDAGDYAGMVLERYKRINDDPNAAGLKNALVEEFDIGMGLFERGTYNILAGRPGMGKSSAASSIALGYAINGHPTLFLNHEMSAEQCAIRSMADTASAMGYEMTTTAMRKGQLSREDLENFAKVEARAGLLPIRFINPGRCDVKRVRSLIAQQCAMWKARGSELQVVVVDYLGLLKASYPDGREIVRGYERMQHVSQAVKDIAADYNVALIALAQLSRAVEQRPNKRPILSDLKESGDLEQDADSVCMLYREEYYLEQEKPKQGEKGKDGTNLYEEWENEMHASRNKLDLIFAKCRHNRTSTQTAKFYPEISSVRSGEFNKYDIGQEEPLLV